MSNKFSEDCFQPTVNKYLSTVLCIDDQFNYENVSPSTLNSVIPGAQVVDEDKTEITDEDNSRTIRVNELIKCFCEKQLLVTPLNPKDFTSRDISSLITNITILAQKADVIILDRELADFPDLSNDELSNKIIQALSKDDRYHYIIIYTADIKEDVENDIRQKGFFDFTNIDICVKTKTGKDSINYEELSNFICNNYLSKKAGLLSGALIEALYKIRSSSSKMLNKVIKDYDKALIYHKCLLDNPEKSIDFVIDLIQDEIVSYICQLKPESFYCNSNSIQKYIETEKLYFSIMDEATQKKRNLKDNEIKYLLTNGFKYFYHNSENISAISKGSKLDWILPGDKKFLKQFSEYSSFISQDVLPTLHLGCIVKANDIMLICLQPPCDSERLPTLNEIEKGEKEPVNFLFIELQLKKSGIDLYINGKGYAFIYKKIKIFSFSGNENGVVENINRKYYHITTSKEEKNGIKSIKIEKEELDYIACLKPMIAQKIANNFSANFSRVGIDQFEWLRLKGK